MYPSKAEITTELKKLLAEDLFVEIPIEKMRDTDSLNTDLGIDSVGHIELISILEERYGVKIDLKAAAAEMTTIGSTVDFVWKTVHAERD